MFIRYRIVRIIIAEGLMFFATQYPPNAPPPRVQVRSPIYLYMCIVFLLWGGYIGTYIYSSYIKQLLSFDVMKGVTKCNIYIGVKY